MRSLKYTLVLLTIGVLAFGSVGCSKNEEANNAVAVEENAGPGDISTTGSAADKVPDPTTPELEVISVFVPRKDSAGIIKELDAIEILDANLLFDKLVEYEVLGSDTKLEDFSVEEDTGVLILNKLDMSNKKLVIALANTFIENFELKTLNIKSVDGETIEGLEFNKEYKNIQ